MLGVVFVTAFGVWDAREAVADVLLERGRYTRRYLAQGVYRIRVENKAHLLASRSEGVHDRLGDQDLAQVADVDVAGGAYAGHRHVRPRSESLGDPFSPVRHRTTSANHALLHDINRGRRYHFEGHPAPSGPALARGLYVDDLVLGSATRRNDRYLISSAALEDGATNRRRVGEFTAPGVRLVGPDNLEGPLLVLTDYPQGHAGAEIYRASLGAGRVHDLRVPQTPLDLANPALQKRLVLVRHKPREYTSGQQRCQRKSWSASQLLYAFISYNTRRPLRVRSGSRVSISRQWRTMNGAGPPVASTCAPGSPSSSLKRRIRASTAPA